MAPAWSNQIEDVILAVLAVRIRAATGCALTVMPRSRSISIEIQHLFLHSRASKRPVDLD